MNRFGAALLSDLQYPLGVEIALAGRGATDTIGLIANFHVQRVFVGNRVNRDTGYSQPACRFSDANRYFAAICDQDFVKHVWARTDASALHPEDAKLGRFDRRI